MIPVIEDIIPDVDITAQPSLSYAINEERIKGYVNGVEAIKQAIYHILNTERYQYIIYSWNYGVELADLFGKPIPYCYSEIKRRITDALIQDDRIESVGDFKLEYKKDSIMANFTVKTVEGDIEVVKEVIVR